MNNYNYSIEDLEEALKKIFNNRVSPNRDIYIRFPSIEQAILFDEAIKNLIEKQKNEKH